jgi:ATPase subunit of ABC transporter with duplicated ATPase domains
LPDAISDVRHSHADHRQSVAAVRGQALFENISVKFGDGNRYGLIGANGCGKSTLMKILGGDLEPRQRS